jgi:hypothetical protein
MMLSARHSAMLVSSVQYPAGMRQTLLYRMVVMGK